MGAGGRDFHNFNMVFRDNPKFEVIAFTATQIPGIAGRTYPPSLSGELYPDGIAILDEAQLASIIRDKAIDAVTFSYSDVSHQEVMHKASIALACGADFMLLGPSRTMLESQVPVIAITAVRTGCGKSQTARWLSRLLAEHRHKVAIIRHPMPYGNLNRQEVQHFASYEDLETAKCTIEEREEYEPHLQAGNSVFAGVDYQKVLKAAENEADIIVWDGGNNDYPFVKPDLHIVLVDPLRSGHEDTYFPGEVVLRMADIIIIAKTNSAPDDDIERLSNSVQAINSSARLIRGASPYKADNPEALSGKRALVIEDGPTTTHGGMPYGAGYLAARDAGTSEIIDPRQIDIPGLPDIYRQYPHLGPILPALGYNPKQLALLRNVINASNADVVVSATPIDLARLIDVTKPVVRIRYDYEDIGEPSLESLVDSFLENVFGKQ